jgi:hypothetical protein
VTRPRGRTASGAHSDHETDATRACTRSNSTQGIGEGNALSGLLSSRAVGAVRNETEAHVFRSRKLSQECPSEVYNEPFILKLLPGLKKPSDDLDNFLSSIPTGLDTQRNSGRSILLQALHPIRLSARVQPSRASLRVCPGESSVLCPLDVLPNSVHECNGRYIATNRWCSASTTSPERSSRI